MTLANTTQQGRKCVLLRRNMGFTTKVGVVIFVVAVVISVVGFAVNSIQQPEGAGANIGAGILLLMSIPLAIGGAVVAIIGFVIDCKVSDTR